MSVARWHKIPVGDALIGSVRLDSGQEFATPLININGGPGGTFYDEHHGLSALSNERDVIFYDQRGCYHSPATHDLNHTDMKNFVEELNEVMGYYNLDKAILLGHSFGACVAIDFALAYPDKVEILILSSPLLSTPRWIKDANILLDDMPEKERSIIQKRLGGEEVDDKEYDAAEMLFYKRHLCRLDPWPERMVKGFSKSNKDIYQTMWGISEFTCTGTLKNYDRMEEFKSFSMPVLLTCGRYDEARPETIMDAAALIKNCQTKIFENSSHAPIYEEREIYLDTIRNFCRS